ncbi:hypothetical protein NHX12_011887 [Muraenolepis orangiensis]|uniref:COMM domain-containing protein 5 n=1 Tax=Muraenolepis orangiensis TaxID=630683 RepID=A0A9Q0I763_9TELE|nr:hypothetical protein NHX12_011887 [Muraenolepis orangiensis]
MKSIAESSVIPEEKLSHIVAGMIPEDFIMDFASVVFGSRRAALEAVTSQRDPHLPTLDDLRWRVDVTISTSSLLRALQPLVLMEMKLSDGSVQQFEVPVSKFQELRYNVALILKEMNHLEKRSVLQIQD